MVWIEPEGPAAEPVTLAEAKSWARIERADEHALIGQLIAAARERVERDTGLVLGVRPFRLCVEDAGPDGRVQLARRPIVSVAAVTAYRADGTPVAFDGNAAVIGRDGASLRVGDAVTAIAVNGLEIEGVAGLASNAVPHPLREAILRLVATGYELRGAAGPAMQPALLTEAVRALVAPFRRVRL